MVQVYNYTIVIELRELRECLLKISTTFASKVLSYIKVRLKLVRFKAIQYN